jgi:hypothetical protein
VRRRTRIAVLAGLASSPVISTLLSLGFVAGIAALTGTGRPTAAWVTDLAPVVLATRPALRLSHRLSGAFRRLLLPPA